MLPPHFISLRWEARLNLETVVHPINLMIIYEKCEIKIICQPGIYSIKPSLFVSGAVAHLSGCLTM